MAAKTIQEQYNKAVERYIKAFMNIMGFPRYSDMYWVADEIGGVFNINDYYFSFDNVKAVVDNSIPRDIVFEYYDLSFEKGSNDNTMPNLLNYYLLSKNEN